MKAREGDTIQLTRDVSAEFSERVLGKGLTGTIIERFSGPEQYTADIALPAAEGCDVRFENVSLTADQFEVIQPVALAPLDELLAAVIAAPDDDAPRIAYAAARDAAGDPRGKAIRLGLALAASRAHSRATRSYGDLLDAWSTLLATHGRDWIRPLEAYRISALRWKRGFVEGITMAAEDFVAHGDAIRALTPLRGVNINGARPELARIARAPSLRQLTVIHLFGQHLDDGDLDGFIRDADLPHVRMLDLGFNTLTDAAVEIICAARAQF
jgi:uncharacterized protein (TIGR02996 family)